MTSTATYKLFSGTYDLSTLIPAVFSLPPAAHTPVTSINGKSGSVYLTPAEFNGLLVPQFNLHSISAGNITCDFSKGLTQKVTLKDAATIGFANAPAGALLTLVLSQDAIGNHPVSWADNIYGVDVSSTGLQASSSSVIQFVYDGANYLLVGSPIVNQ